MAIAMASLPANAAAEQVLSMGAMVPAPLEVSGVSCRSLLPVEAGLNTVVGGAGRISRPALHIGLARGSSLRAERMDSGYQ